VLLNIQRARFSANSTVCCCLSGLKSAHTEAQSPAPPAS
jgi:hypothetical protein